MNDAEQTTQSLVSAIDRLKEIAATNPAAVRACDPFLCAAVDELVELVVKLDDRRLEAAE